MRNGEQIIKLGLHSGVVDRLSSHEGRLEANQWIQDSLKKMLNLTRDQTKPKGEVNGTESCIENEKREGEERREREGTKERERKKEVLKKALERKVERKECVK